MAQEKEIEREIREEELRDAEKPVKGNQASTVVATLLLCTGILVVGVAGFNLFSIFRDYHQSNEVYDSLVSDYVSVKTDFPKVEPGQEPEKEKMSWYDMAAVDLAGVKALNSDTVGWLFFENEEINYPIMYSGDNEKYLRTTFDGRDATAGSIFMEGENNPDFEDSHTIIYGHNMKNLSMFGRLKYYNRDGYYKDHGYFQIFTEKGVYRYQIFAYADIPENSSVYRVPFSDSPEFAVFIDDLYRTSFYNTGVAATSSDKIVTLSTCSTDKRRFVVHGVRVDYHPYS